MSKSLSLPLNVSALLRNIDMLKLEDQPLQDHFAASCDEHSRITYATLLAALLLSGGEINDDQSRLFKLLLGSLKLGDIQTQLFERAQALNSDALREFVRLTDENKLATSFFMDALVMCRLRGPLVDAQHQLLSELVDLLKLPEVDLQVIVNLTALALGLPCEENIPANFDYQKVNAWEEFLYQTLTVKKLTTGVLQGRWQVTEPLKVNASWRLANARLKFTENGSLHTVAECQVSIVGSHLSQPVINLAGKVSLVISNSVIVGQYAELACRTAITIKDIDFASFKNVQFETRFARSILILDCPVEIDGCQFVGCGNSKMVGGAIAARTKGVHSSCSDEVGIKISNSSFIGCIAKLGGGIRVSDLSSHAITKTNFDNCISLAYFSKDISSDLEGYAFGGGAIFSDNCYPHYHGSCISECKFKNTSVNLGNDRQDSRSQPGMTGCDFIESYLSYGDSNGYGVSGGSFKNKLTSFTSKEIKREFQPWWNEYK